MATDEERRVRATLEVHKEGDERAFGELASDVERLRDEAGDVDPGLAALQDRLRGIGVETKELQDKLGSAGKEGGGGGLLGGLSGFPKVLGGAIAAAATFKEAWSQTREIVSLVRENFGIDIDAMVTKALGLEDIAAKILGLGESVEETAQLLQNQQRIFDNLNLDGFTSNVEKNDELLNQHFKSIAEGAAAMAKKKGEVEDFLDGFGLSAERNAKKADDLAKKILAVFEVHPDTDPEKLRAALGEQLDVMFAALDKAEPEVRDRIQRVADLFGGLAPKIEATSQQVAITVEGLIRGVLGQVDPAPVFERVTSVNEALALIGSNLTGEAAEKVRADLQKVVDEVRASGGKLEPEVADLAAKFGVYVTALDVAGGYSATLSKATGEVAANVEKVASAAESAATAQDQAAKASTEQGRGLGEVESKAPGVATALQDVAAAASGISDVDIAGPIVSQMNQIVEAAGRARQAISDLNTAGEAAA